MERFVRRLHQTTNKEYQTNAERIEPNVNTSPDERRQAGPGVERGKINGARTLTQRSHLLTRPASAARLEPKLLKKRRSTTLTYRLGKKGFFAPFPNFMHACATEPERVSSTPENAEHTTATGSRGSVNAPRSPILQTRGSHPANHPFAEPHAGAGRPPAGWCVEPRQSQPLPKSEGSEAFE